MSNKDQYLSPLSTRYASPEMQQIFSENFKFRTWRKLWISLAKAEKALGLDITDEQIAELLETVELQEFYVGRKDADHIKGLDSKFHRQLYKFSGSAILNDTLLPLHKKVQKFRKAAVENENRAQNSAQEHRAIYEAIAKRDPDLAEKRTYEHIRNAATHIKIEL